MPRSIVLGAALSAVVSLAPGRPARAADTASPPNVVALFTQAFFLTRVWEQTTWLGVHSFQTPTDNWVMQEIISEVKPDVIVETGTRNGGTALYYASLLSLLGIDHGKVLTVDVEPKTDEAAKRKLFRDHVVVFTGDSVAPEIVARIAEAAKGKKVLVTLDSLHTKAHVLKEMERYGPLVSAGSYMVVQDTAANGHPIPTSFGEGPMEAVEEYLKTHDDFTVDKSREKFLLTFHPSGFLKRK